MSIASFRAAILALLAAPAVAMDLPEADAVFPEPNGPQIELGRLLFYDPILSGNKTVSCATCHHPKHATSDGVSLGLGDGGIGLGPDRVVDPDECARAADPSQFACPLQSGGGGVSGVFSRWAA